ncbi:MAG: 4a-hydroxytetrahydrobiopterin dehydratase [Planctomycetaceae bacterium]|nr:4a-hydroxytetrahydrobiopterin dehydratase [Planctomycetaceae bacterium]
MTTANDASLVAKHCTTCEGQGTAYSPSEVERQLANLSGWRPTADGRRIRKDWQVKDFKSGIEFFQQVADLAESENHHPDLHLEDYRHVWIELWSHALGGLSENDFILAAKIDHLPVQLRVQHNAP